MTKAPTTPHGRLVHLGHRVPESVNEHLERLSRQHRRSVAEVLHDVLSGRLDP